MASNASNNLDLLGPYLTDEQSFQATLTAKEAEGISRLILNIVFDYALNKFDDSKDRLTVDTDKFLSMINHFVTAGRQVEACLSSFPFKSANKVYKVLGTLPDKAEELALERLNYMCIRIQDVYRPGAKVTIVSDGAPYNDLLSISDRDTWAYKEALRKMAVQKGFDNIKFAGIEDLLDNSPSEKLSEITYVANCTNFRRLLLNKYGKPNLDIDYVIATDSDTKLKYLGFRRFLESDLKHVFLENRSRRGYKRDVECVAKQMLIRGYAFSAAVTSAFPKYLRLTIHESMHEPKIPICLLNTKTSFTTPWHCNVALLADGEWISAPMGDFQKISSLELVYEDGRPSYFKENPNEADVDCKEALSYLHVPGPVNRYRYLSGHSTPDASGNV